LGLSLSQLLGQNSPSPDTLAVERIGKVMGRASPEELAQVVEGLNEIIET
jgi:hypothetical protein